MCLHCIIAFVCEERKVPNVFQQQYICVLATCRDGASGPAAAAVKRVWPMGECDENNDDDDEALLLYSFYLSMLISREHYLNRENV